MSGSVNSTSRLRGFLVLARASNLPTVWSNCLAGALLVAPVTDLLSQRFLLFCVGASLIYIGGMFLNDAFDVAFDRQFRKERPIPSGLISARTVWSCGVMFLILGLIALTPFGPETITLTLALIVLVVAYDAWHKKTILSPILMGACRVLLYFVAASPVHGLPPLFGWFAGVLGLYVVGLSYVAKAESAPGPLRYWPLLLLASPLLLAVSVNRWGTPLLIPSLLFIGWTAWSLRYLFGVKQKNIGAAVSGLLAGIVFVDLLAVGSREPLIAVAFFALFVAARLFQKYIPAT